MSDIEDEGNLFGLQENEAVEIASGSENEEDDGNRDNDRDDEAVEVPEGGANAAPKVIKPKRVVKNPQPKLDVARLCGPRGIGIIQKWLSSAPYKGKGHETEDLGLLLKKLQHWAHRLYPKLPFNDAIAQIEKLGNKKALQVNVKKLRMDIFETPTEGNDEITDDIMRVGDADNADKDIFDELLEHSTPVESLRDRAMNNMSQSQGLTALPTQPIVLTDEQKARIERNKQVALERRQTLMGQRLGGGTEAADISNDNSEIQATPSDLRDKREDFLNTLSQKTSTQIPDFDDDDFDAMEVDDMMKQMEDKPNKEIFDKGVSGDLQKQEGEKDDNLLNIDEVLDDINDTTNAQSTEDMVI